ncbi:glycosyltransferase family 4 protein [Wukongibacter sp. M2B1]|uniref:glycosyltransferase family 4 protein n=1 Tax=Wukongibacter sp. M2B1 TaxID=3088895 RepID=UPI003D79BFEF
MKIGLFGIYPPPIGGISVHIKRLSAFLYKKNIDVTVYSNCEKKGNESYVREVKNKKIQHIENLFNSKDDIIHIHSHSWKERAILTCVSKFYGKIFIMTIHSLKEKWDELNLMDRILVKYVLKYSTKIISVGVNEKKKLVSWGCSEDKIVVLPAYINPIEIIEDRQKIPREVWSFIDKSKFIISANGCIRFHRGEDLYGIDMLIDLVHRLKNSYDVSLIIALLDVYGQGDEQRRYYKELREKISKLSLQEKIFIFEVKDTEFYPILQKSNLFIRPTNTDGDAISLREALYFKIPSIASDIVARPKGTISFKNRDIDDLEEKVIDIIRNYDKHKRKLKDIKIKDYAQDVLNLYESI